MVKNISGIQRSGRSTPNSASAGYVAHTANAIARSGSHGPWCDSSTRHAYGATNTSINRKNKRSPQTWTGRTPSWRGSGEKNRTSGWVDIASVLGRQCGIEGEQVAGLAFERGADRLERGEADRLRLAGLED